MNTQSQRIRLALAVAVSTVVCIGALPGAALAQAYPAKPVRIVLPIAPGGLQDQLARGIANELSKLWGQPVIVENRPSAGGIASVENVARSAADGYSIMEIDNFSLVTNQLLRKNLPYNLDRDFTPVIVLVAAKNIVVASNDLPAKNIQELMVLARAKPGALNYGSFGIGSIAHIDMEAIAALAGVTFTHIPYKGGAPLMQAVMTNEVSFALAGMTAAIPLIRQGRIKALAYGGLQHSTVFPDLPTLSESGLKGFESAAWFGWWVPAGTPQTIVGKIYTDTAKVLATAEFQEKFVFGAGHEPSSLPGTKIAELLKENIVTVAARIKSLNLTLE